MAGAGSRWGVLILLILLMMAPPTAALHGGSFGQVSPVEADTVQLNVDLGPTGDAAWEIRYRIRLETENETAAFDSLAADVEANRSAYVEQFRSRIGSTVAAAENATGRSMTVRNVSVHTERQEIPQRYGVLVYTFEWTGFAVTEGTTIRAGDAIAGLYLDEASSLTIRWPDGYTPTSVDPSADERGDRAVTWRGPVEFSGQQPRVAVAETTPTGTATPTAATPGDGTDETPATDEDGDLPMILLLGVGGLALLFAAAWWWRRRDDGSATTATGSDPEATPPEELLSNEERVLQLIESRGGRMKQQQVVEELGWTDAKTSQVVSNLRESGELEGFRLGRENVLHLPDEAAGLTDEE